MDVSGWKGPNRRNQINETGRNQTNGTGLNQMNGTGWNQTNGTKLTESNGNYAGDDAVERSMSVSFTVMASRK
jgi:hypothetical protein